MKEASVKVAPGRWAREGGPGKVDPGRWTREGGPGEGGPGKVDPVKVDNEGLLTGERGVLPSERVGGGVNRSRYRPISRSTLSRRRFMGNGLRM